MNDEAKCELCGLPMPEGETMFKFHGYSGPCPGPSLQPTSECDVEFEEALEMFQQWATAYGQDISTREIDAQAEMHRAKVKLRYVFYRASHAQPTSEALRPSENRIVRRLMQVLKIEPCRDHSCVQGGSPVKGMGTNGGCRCANNVESAVFDILLALGEK